MGRGYKLTVKNDLLRNCKLGITRARRQIQHQYVDTAPIHLVQELLYGFHHHRAPPHDGASFGDEIAHRHGLDSVVC